MENQKQDMGTGSIRKWMLELAVPAVVAHIIKKYYTQAANQEDLISIGTIGLIKAVNSFQPDKKIRLATYASRCIENAILT